MTKYRRARQAGATYFFTVALANRRSDLLTRNIVLLRDAYETTRAERPFRCDAIVVLPDHLHAVWTLPDGDADYPTRWRMIKSRFTRDLGVSWPRSASQIAKGEKGVWQRRYWEHQIRDEEDYALHVRYCWGNPVKHGYVERAAEWPYSSIHRDIRARTVEPEWAGAVVDGAFGE